MPARMTFFFLASAVAFNILLAAVPLVLLILAGARLLAQPLGVAVARRCLALRRGAAPAARRERDVAVSQGDRRDHPHAPLRLRHLRGRLRLALDAPLRLPALGARERLRCPRAAEPHPRQALRHRAHRDRDGALHRVHRHRDLPAARHVARRPGDRRDRPAPRAHGARRVRRSRPSIATLAIASCSSRSTSTSPTAPSAGRPRCSARSSPRCSSSSRRWLFEHFIRSTNPGTIYTGALYAIIIVVFWTYYAALIFLDRRRGRAGARRALRDAAPARDLRGLDDDRHPQ